MTSWFRGVSSFLAPPPSNTPAAADSEETTTSSSSFEGIKNDLLEIGDSFKSSLFNLASNLLSQFDDNDDDDYDVVGVTDRVLHFVREISVRPECWIDFPLPIRKGFDMTDVQKEHALAIEHLVPSLRDLRQKIRSSLTESQFWMIYFILLLPRLNEDDSKLLSTPEIVEVREVLLQKLKNKNKTPVEISEEPETANSSDEGREVYSERAANSSDEGREVYTERAMKNSPPVAGKVSETQRIETEHDSRGLLPVEGNVDTYAQTEDEGNLSFSDLEDDVNALSGKLSGVRVVSNNKVGSRSESSDWVQLVKNSGSLQHGTRSTFRERHSEGEESSDWFTVDDADLDS